MKNIIFIKYSSLPLVMINKIPSIAIFICLLFFSSCSTEDPDINSSDECYEGIIVRDNENSCDFIVQMKIGNIGEDWDDLKNCIHIKNLPDESKKIGSHIFFKNYKSIDSQFCPANQLGLPKSIIIENYSSTKCP